MNNPNDLISRDAAIKWFFRPYSNEESYSNLNIERALKAIPAVDAIPVEWLREKIKEHTDEKGWQDYLANSFGLCIEEWQKEQEAQDG